MIYGKIPKERIGVLVGHDGSTRDEIERRSGSKLHINSETGETVVVIEDAEDPVLGIKAADVVKAIARGFSPERSFRLFEEDTYLTMLDIRDYAGKSKKRIRQVRGRIIGSGGRTRELIEELTGADISIYGSTVSVIGDMDEANAAVKALEMLLDGSEHSTVYHFLEKQHKYLKMSRMGMVYYDRREEP